MSYTITNVEWVLIILVITPNPLTTNYVSWKFMVVAGKVSMVYIVTNSVPLTVMICGVTSTQVTVSGVSQDTRDQLAIKNVSQVTMVLVVQRVVVLTVT